MKLIKVLLILIISSFSYYGVVDDNGEKVTNIQEIMQEQKNYENVETVAKAENIEIDVVEEKKEEVEVKKVETKAKKEEAPKTETKKETKPVETVATETKQKNKEEENKVVETETKTVKKQEKTEEKAEQITQKETVKVHTSNCSSGNHGMSVGNSGKWFKTKDEAIQTYRTEINLWGDKWTTNQITDEEYYKNCPYGYEVWTCPYCELWTLNYYYE